MKVLYYSLTILDEEEFEDNRYEAELKINLIVERDEFNEEDAMYIVEAEKRFPD